MQQIFGSSPCDISLHTYVGNQRVVQDIFLQKLVKFSPILLTHAGKFLHVQEISCKSQSDPDFDIIFLHLAYSL